MKKKILLSVAFFILVLFIFSKTGINEVLYQSAVRGNLGFLNALKKEKIYILPTDYELEFPVPDVLEGLRLSLRPVLEKKEDYDFEKILYKIHYKLVSKEDEILEERDYWVYHDIDQDLVVEAQERFFYEKPDLQPIHPKPIFLPLAKESREGKLFIKLVTEDPNVEEVLVNLKFREKVPDYRKRPGWERMPKHIKKIIARENIYDVKHLSADEKTALTLNKWRPIAPEGIAQEDFEEHLFFEDTGWIDEQGGKGRTSLSDLPKDGVLIGPDRDFSVTIPIENKDLKLQFVEVMGPFPDKVRLTWYGREVFEIESNEIEVQDQVTVQPKPGILVISSASYVFLRAILTDKNFPKQSIKVSQPVKKGSYVLSKTDPVFYAVHHTKKAFQSAYKFDFKIRSESAAELFPEEVQVFELDESQKVLKQHKVLVQSQISTTDFEAKKVKKRISLPTPAFFYPTKKTAFFKLVGSPKVLVNAFSRLKQHEKINFVPNDFYQDKFLKGDEPAWFFIRPFNELNLVRQGRLYFYVTHRLIPERKDYLIRGEYDLVDFRPVGDWSGQFFLMKMKNPNYKPRPSSYVYGPIKTNQSHFIKFESEDLKGSFRPHLVVKNLSKISKTVTAFLDGKKIFSKNPMSKNFHINLPVIKPGFHELELKLPPGALAYTNYHAPKEAVYLKKLAYKLSPWNVLKFKFKKRKIEEETALSVRIFQINKDFEHIRLKSEISDRRPYITNALDTFTLEKQEWNTGPDVRHKSLIFNNSEKVSEGTPFSIYFGKDYSQVSTDVSFRLKEGKLIYLSLFELAPVGDVEYNETKSTSEESQ